MQDAEFEYSVKNPRSPVAYASFGAMNTVMEMVLVGISREDAMRLVALTQERVCAMDRKLNRHNPQSLMWQINDTAFSKAVEVDEQSYMLLEMCELFRRSTDGYFDIGALSQPCVAPAYVLDRNHRTVRLTQQGAVLDLGGFAKGYAVDVVRKMLVENGVMAGIINFGNSSVVGIGSHPYGESWPVGIDQTCSFALRDSALSVSGKSPSGRSHIVDPVSGTRPDSDLMVAVNGTSPLICEVLSTALYAAPTRARGEILTQYTGYEAFCIDDKGNKYQIGI